MIFPNCDCPGFEEGGTERGPRPQLFPNYSYTAIERAPGLIRSELNSFSSEVLTPDLFSP